MKKLLTTLLATFALSLALGPEQARAAPSGIKDTNIDLDLKQASATNVYRLLAQVSGRSITLDPCVTMTVDLRLINTPLPLVFDALASQLKLVYDDNDDGIYVRCQETGATHAAPTSVTFAENDAPLPDVLERLAASAKLEGVDYRASKRPPVTMTLRGVRLSTAVAALSDSTGLRVAIKKNRLVATDGT